LLAAGVSIVTSDGIAQTTARDYCNRGVARQKKGDLDGALADYNRAIELNPHDATPYNNRGLVKMAKGNLDGALADYDRALQISPRNFEIHANRGVVRQRKGDLNGALADYDIAIKLYRKSASAYSNRASLKMAKNDLDGALADCNRAIEFNPKDATAYHNRALIETAKGDLDAATADFNRAIKLDPKYARKSPAALNKAKIESAGAPDKRRPIEPSAKNLETGKNGDLAAHQKGDLNGARPEPDHAPSIEIEPKSIAAVYDRDVAKRTQSDHDAAIGQHAPAVALPPKTSEAPGDAGRKTALDRPAEKTSPTVELAPREIETSRSTELPKPNTNDLSGEVAPPAAAPEPEKLTPPADASVATQKDNLSGDSADYDRAIERDPTTAVGYENRAQFRKATGDLNGALADFNRAIELNGGNAIAYYNRGVTKQTNGDLDGALADFNPAIQLDPKNAAAYHSRGVARTMKGDLDGALADYNRAIELDPKDAATYNNRAGLFFLVRNWGAALEDYNRFFELSEEGQEDPRLYVWLIHARTGQTDAANKELVDYLQQRANTADWFSTVASYLLGRKSDADLLAAAKSSDKKKENGQLCEAWFYIGMKKVIGGDKSGAQDCFNKSLATDQKDYAEYHFARTELKALRN